MSNGDRNLMVTSPEEVLDLYLRERSTDAADSTRKPPRVPTEYFIRW